MKEVILLQEFLLDYADAEQELTRIIVKKWFYNSNNSLNMSKNCYYNFVNILFNKFVLKNDGVSFKINWNEVQRVFNSDKEFIEKLNEKKGGVKYGKTKKD